MRLAAEIMSPFSEHSLLARSRGGVDVPAGTFPTGAGAGKQEQAKTNLDMAVHGGCKAMEAGAEAAAAVVARRVAERVRQDLEATKRELSACISMHHQPYAG